MASEEPGTASGRLSIIYQDQALVAINKPPGLLVHRSSIDYHETINAQESLQRQLKADVYPAHRLDKPTSGVLLFALDRATATAVAEQFQNKKIKKDYLAVVRGHAEDAGTIDNPVRDKDAPHKPRKDALTAFSTLARITLPVAVDRYPEARYSIVCVQPHTGRRHQIRQHMKHINHPLIGDTSYGKTVHNRFFSQHFSCSRLLLHAQKLMLRHPDNENEIVITADYNDEFRQVLEHPLWQWTNIERSGIHAFANPAYL